MQIDFVVDDFTVIDYSVFETVRRLANGEGDLRPLLGSFWSRFSTSYPEIIRYKENPRL